MINVLTTYKTQPVLQVACSSIEISNENAPINIGIRLQ